MKTFTEEEIFKELQRIQRSVPELLRKSVVRKTPATPTVAMVVEKALEDPDFPEEKKEELRKLKENGHFDTQNLITDPKVEKEIDAYVNREIKKAVKEGRLPNRKQLAVILKK